MLPALGVGEITVVCVVLQQLVGVVPFRGAVRAVIISVVLVGARARVGIATGTRTAAIIFGVGVGAQMLPQAFDKQLPPARGRQVIAIQEQPQRLGGHGWYRG